MSPVTPTADPLLDAAGARATRPLRNLYLARFGFALVWAGLLAASASDLNPVSVALLAAYPAFDLAAAVYDLRSSGDGRARTSLFVNLALSALTAVGLLAAASSGVPAVLRVWGAWAIAAGAVQLVVALQRYRWGGQWPMVLSGGISVFAGGGFIAMASGDEPTLTSLAGYAVLGGIFFLASAIRLHTSSSRAAR